MFKLTNNTSFVISSVTHGFYPRRYIQIEMTLAQTPGVTAVDPETVDRFGVHYSLYYDMNHESTASIATDLVGSGINAVKQWVKAEYDKYNSGLGCDAQLVPIFEYVKSVGLVR